MSKNEKAKRLAHCIGDIDDQVIEEAGERRSSRPKYLAVLAAAACLMLAAAVVIPFLVSGAGRNTPAISTGEAVTDCRSYDDIYTLIEQMRADHGDMAVGAYTFTTGAAADDAVREESAAEVPASDARYDSDIAKTAETNGAADYSETNVQVKGVDEGDIIKTDGKYIYRLYDMWRDGKVAIISAADLKLAGELCAVSGGKDNRSVHEMYVSGDRLALIGNYNVYFDGDKEISYDEFAKRDEQFWDDYYSTEHEDYSDWTENYTLRSENRTFADIFDISDRTTPKIIASSAQSGYYVSSRMSDGKLYIVTTYNIGDAQPGEPITFIPYTVNGGECRIMPATDICIFDNPDTPGYTVVGALDIDTAGQYDSVKAVFGRAGNVYANANNMIVTATRWNEDTVEGTENGKNVTTVTDYSDTDIVLFSLGGGNVEQKASGRIKGSLLNQFAIDEYNGYFRFVTTENININKIYTDGVDTYEYENKEVNGLYVLDGDLNIVGSIEDLAPDEMVYSVRFDGSVGYFVTFRQVDPLFTVDLSDPTAPRILSTLKIPGFSQYLHPFADGRLFGLGMDADENGRTKSMKMTMFDTSDPANVTEKHTLILDGFWSEALSNHKAIVVSREKDIIAFPKENGYVVYGYSDESGFYKRAEFEFDENGWFSEMRGLYIGDDFFVVDDCRAAKYSMPSFDKTADLQFAEQTDREVFFID